MVQDSREREKEQAKDRVGGKRMWTWMVTWISMYGGGMERMCDIIWL